MNPQTPPNTPVPPAYPPDPTGPKQPGHEASPQAQPSLQSNDYKLGFERPRDRKMHPMVVLQEGEVIVGTLKRHPFGIVSLYITALAGITVTGILAFLMLPDLASQFGGDSSASTLAIGIAASMIVLLILVLGVATSVYWQNEWVITTDSITQITQNSLFGRQVSQLSMDNLEDVTVDQHGIIPHMFNFGTLKVESAGERSKFVFPYCPRPNEYARRILEVHEHFLEERRNVQRHPGGPSHTSIG